MTPPSGSPPLGVDSPDLSPFEVDDDASTPSPPGVDARVAEGEEDEEEEEGSRVSPFISVVRAGVVDGLVDSLAMMNEGCFGASRIVLRL